MNEKGPSFSPEEEKLSAQRGGYLSGASRRGEAEKEDGRWTFSEEFKEKAKGEMERELAMRAIPGPAAEREEKVKEKKEEKAETKEEFSDELKDAYFEYQDLARKMKRRWVPNRPLEEKWVEAKRKYHELLAEGVSEKTSKGFYLPEEMAPEGGPKEYNFERLEKMVGTELVLQKEYEKKSALESEKNAGLLKKLWRGYTKLPKSTKMAVSVGLATGAAVLAGPAFGLWAAASYGGLRAARSVFGGIVAATIYKGLDKWLTPYVEKAAQKNIEKMKKKQAETLNDIRISATQGELLFAKENIILEYKKREWQKRRINIEKALVAGALGIGASFAVEPAYEHLSETKGPKTIPPEAVSPETGGGEVEPPDAEGFRPSEGEAATVPPAADQAAETFQEQYSHTVERGGNVWKATKEVAKQAGLSDKEFADTWHRSFVDVPGRGMVHISEVNLVHPGTEVYYDAQTNAFYVKGEGLGPKIDGIPIETPPERPFEHLPTEEAPAEKPPTFTELEEGYIDSDKFVSERLASFGIDSEYYDQIKNAKVKDLLKIRKGTFWDLFRHLNDDTAGRADIFAEWKLAVLVKTELKNLLPLVEDKTIDEAVKFAAHNRHLIK